MNKGLILSLLIAFTGSLFSCKSASKEEPRRDDGLVNTFFIRNAQLTPAITEEFNLIFLMDFALTERPDSEYAAAIMPGTGVLVATNKDIIKPLFPEATEWMVNGKKVTEEEFYATPGQMLTIVTYYNGLLKCETRDNVNDGNPYAEEVNKESEAWYIENNGTPMPAEVALNDPETYFLNPNTIVTLDYVFTSPAKVQEADVKGYVLSMMGANPLIHALTNTNHLNYFGVEGEGIDAEVSAINGSLTAENVAKHFNRPLEDLLLIRTDGQTVKAFFKQ